MLTNNKAMIAISVLGAVLSIVLSGFHFHFSYFEPDTVSYLSYHSHTDSIVARIVAKSPSDQNWVTLKLCVHVLKPGNHC